MSVIAWVAVAVVVTSGGQSTIASDPPFADKASCERANAAAVAEVIGHPNLVAIGTSCIEVKVDAVEHPEGAAKPSPKPKRVGGDTI